MDAAQKIRDYFKSDEYKKQLKKDLNGKHKQS
jgi:hypothetical protein